MAKLYRTALQDSSIINVTAGSNVIAEGDSLSLHLKKYNGLQGEPVLGRTPSDVLTAIKGHLASNPNYYRGKDVVLSSGATNDRSQVEMTREQIQTLKAAGATVVLIGVGPGKNNQLDGVNQKLSDIAKEEHVGFVTAPTKEFDWDSEKKHIGPDANRALFGHVQEKFKEAHSSTPQAALLSRSAPAV